MTVTMMSRSEIAQTIEQEGFEISERTLRYWESVGLLPKAQRIGRRALHNPAILGNVRLLAATRPKAVAAIRSQYVVRDGNKQLRFRINPDGSLSLSIRIIKEQDD